MRLETKVWRNGAEPDLALAVYSVVMGGAFSTQIGDHSFDRSLHHSHVARQKLLPGCKKRML